MTASAAARRALLGQLSMDGVGRPDETSVTGSEWLMVWRRGWGDTVAVYLPHGKERLGIRKRSMIAKSAKARARVVLITTQDINTGDACKWIAWALWGDEADVMAARAKYPRRRVGA